LAAGRINLAYFPCKTSLLAVPGKPEIAGLGKEISQKKHPILLFDIEIIIIIEILNNNNSDNDDDDNSNNDNNDNNNSNNNGNDSNINNNNNNISNNNWKFSILKE
ncbi:hypothetical protein WUBG_04521, partial [Wuchereria bancrofti]